jgi:hypothetical protein
MTLSAAITFFSPSTGFKVSATIEKHARAKKPLLRRIFGGTAFNYETQPQTDRIRRYRANIAMAELAIIDEIRLSGQQGLMRHPAPERRFVVAAVGNMPVGFALGIACRIQQMVDYGKRRPLGRLPFHPPERRQGLMRGESERSSANKMVPEFPKLTALACLLGTRSRHCIHGCRP